jgi:hypothetical protein
MKALWLFVFLIVFCVYVLYGLYLTENADSLSQIILTWVIYTILWTTFINVFLLGYFWSVVRNKSGPVGLRGPSGERGKVGIKGQCSITAAQAYCIKALNEYIDKLYSDKKGQNILDENLQTFPNNYLNDKIIQMAGSRQYQVILGNLSNDNKPIENIINYLKSIWYKWFELIYKSTDVEGAWFKDEYGDEDYNWVGANPFLEIRKYDIYYWGITRNFRPLKAELCRTSLSHTNPKFPIPNRPLEPRLKIIQTNDYYMGAYDRNSGSDGHSVFWQPHTIDIGNDTYYPLGSVMTADSSGGSWDFGYYHTHDNIITGNPNGEHFSYTKQNAPGFDIRTALVAGDVKDPAYFQNNGGWSGDDDMISYTPICPGGYTDLGDVMGRYGGYMNPEAVNMKCVPTECVEEVHGNRKYPWGGQANGDLYVLNDYTSGQNDANGDNGYNLVRINSGKPFYKIKESCLSLPSHPGILTKDVEPQNGDLGIGWYGHPYKLEPEYSIFTFLNLVPEGMIVHKGTGRRFYILHYGGEEQNVYNILDFSEDNYEFSDALQTDSNANNSAVKSRTKSRLDPRQQWIIVLQGDKYDSSKLNRLKLKSLFNNKYLYLGLDALQGTSQFSTVDIATYMYHPAFQNLSAEQVEDGTMFTFISSVGTNMNIINNEGLVT